MRKTRIKEQVVFSEPEDQDTALLVGNIVKAASKMIKQHWGLSSPGQIRVYLMTDMVKFRLQSAPWPQKINRILSFPCWYYFATKLWPQVRGVAEPHRLYPAIGIKPPRLLGTTSQPLLQTVMVEEPGLVSTLRHIVCHELTHVFTAHQNLPWWLNEGLAILASEVFVGMPLIKPQSLSLLKPNGQGQPPESYHWTNIHAGEILIYETVRGYWITRYLEEKYPRLLRKIIVRMRNHNRIHKTIADQLSMDSSTFWMNIDAVMASHFSLIKK